MSSNEIPVLDLEPFRTSTHAEQIRVARTWNEIFETLAFVTVVGHGIPLALLDALQAEAKAFFDLPIEEKMRCAHPGEQRSQGYLPVGGETVARSKGDGGTPAFDLCESLTFPYLNWEMREITNELDRRAYRPNRWPATRPRLRELSLAYTDHAHQLISSLMRLSALALELPDDYFTRFFDRMLMYLRFTNYPEQPEMPTANQYRYGSHTDYLGFTILLPEDAPGGLQVLMPDGTWKDIRPIRGGLVINTGDLIARWTNDRWRSVVHRVANPERDVALYSRRLSVVMFTGPNFDAVISCLPSCVKAGSPPRYQPVTTSAYLQQKLRATMHDQPAQPGGNG
jgi:isopenicillin N synthase-like dioxygenase